MGYGKILPDSLIDWIERTRAPERYYRLVAILLRNSNWGDGTYSDGVKLKRGQVRVTERKLAKILGYSKSAINRLLLNLKNAGWIEIQSENNLTIISLVWITKAGHPNRSKRDTVKVQAGHQAGQENTSETRDKKHQEEHKTGRQTQESGTPKSTQAGIGNIRIIETKELETNEDKNRESDINTSRPSGKSDLDSEEEKKIDREEKEEITDTLLQTVVEKVKAEFKVRYRIRFNRFPVIDRKSTERVLETLKESASNREELSDIVNRLIQKIPDFFKKTDKWVMQHGYSWYAFSWRIADLLSEPVRTQATNTPGVNFKVSVVKIG